MVIDLNRFRIEIAPGLDDVHKTLGERIEEQPVERNLADFGPQHLGVVTVTIRLDAIRDENDHIERSHIDRGDRMTVDGLNRSQGDIRKDLVKLFRRHRPMEQRQRFGGRSVDLDAVSKATDDELVVVEHLIPIVHQPGKGRIEQVDTVGMREIIRCLCDPEGMLVAPLVILHTVTQKLPRMGERLILRSGKVFLDIQQDYPFASERYNPFFLMNPMTDSDVR